MTALHSADGEEKFAENRKRIALRFDFPCIRIGPAVGEVRPQM